MKKLFTTAIWSICLVCICSMLQAQTREAAYEILSDWNGSWRGVFRIYSATGRLLDSLRVEQKYYWDGNTQRGVITDTYTDGRIEVSHAENFVRNDTLFCVVRNAKGEKTVHAGHFSGDRLTWSRWDRQAGLQEIFKEYVVRTEQGSVYFIDGVGIYGMGEGRNVLLFEGRYRKVAE